MRKGSSSNGEPCVPERTQVQPTLPNGGINVEYFRQALFDVLALSGRERVVRVREIQMQFHGIPRHQMPDDVRGAIGSQINSLLEQQRPAAGPIRVTGYPEREKEERKGRRKPIKGQK